MIWNGKLKGPRIGRTWLVESAVWLGRSGVAGRESQVLEIKQGIASNQASRSRSRRPWLKRGRMAENKGKHRAENKFRNR